MATSLYKAQEALKTCNEHQNEELSCFCKTCKKFICTTCAKTSHHGHEWDFIPLVAKKRRKETPILCRKLKKDNLSRCREKLHAVHENIADVEKASDEDVKRLEERRTAMIDAVNQIIDEQKRKRVYIKEKESTRLQEDLSQLRTKIEYLDKMTTSLDDNIDAYTDFDVIEMEIDMLKALAELEAYNVDSTVIELTFVPGKINHVVIEEMIGRIEETAKANVDESVSVEEMETFTEFKKMINTVAPISNDQAFVSEFQNYTIKKLSLHSTETNAVTLAPHSGFVPLSDGDLIVIGYKNQAIRRVTSAGKESVIVSTKPLHPNWISKTNTNDLLVTLKDDRDHYKLEPSSRRLVQRMTLSGKVLQTNEFREDGVTRLFTAPTKTAENGNSDICVINRTSGEAGELIVLHRDGRVRATYRGNMDSNFDPTDVTCDEKRRIVVTDYSNKFLHLLSPDGAFLRYLMSDMFDYPHTMALYQGNLWVGFLKGAVKVYQYKT